MASLPPLVGFPQGADGLAWDAACAAVRAYCGWHIAPSITEDITLDGPGGQVLLLPTLQLTALNSISNDGAVVTDPQWSQVGMVRIDYGCWWTCKYRGITANITHGFDDCPPEVVAVIQEAASRGIEGSFVSQVGQVSAGGVSGVSGAAAFVRDRSAILDRYKLPPRP